MAVENSNQLVTDEQIARWKEKYGEIFCIEAEDGSICYLHKPNRATLDAFFAASKNLLKSLETIVKNCFLGGDESFKTDESKLMSVGEHIETIIQVKKSSLKTL